VKRELNPYISVDCVIFGYDLEALKVLLVEREYLPKHSSESKIDMKLPGSLVFNDEDLEDAANRILKELTGLDKIYLEQLYTFGSPDRTRNKIDVEWLSSTTLLNISRIVTVAYYSLIKINKTTKISKNFPKAKWVNVKDIKNLAFDHLQILNRGLDTLRNKISNEPIGFELLPEKFTIRQLQNLHEIIIDQKLDNRNFRKKLVNKDYIIPLKEKQTKVPHKPARLFKFDQDIYFKNKKEFNNSF
jgi:hypothetical protein